MMMLNPSEYLKEGYTISNNMVYDPSGNLVYRNMGAYYSRSSGYKPSSISGGATSYGGTSVDFSSTGLNATARNLVQENVWYLSSPSNSGDAEFDANELGSFYKYERNGKVTYGENSITWRGKVGLMYLSDYYYANNVLYNSGFFSYNFIDGCGDNWLCVFDGGEYEWTLAHLYYPSYYMTSSGQDMVTEVYRVNGYEYDSKYDPNATNVVRPTVYLKSGIKVTGDGTIDSKFQIVS